MNAGENLPPGPMLKTQSIKMRLSSQIIAVGQVSKAELFVVYEDWTSAILEPGSAQWSSSNEAVATVDAMGNISAISIGEATISAAFGEFSDSSPILVPNADESLVHILISPDNVQVEVGKTLTFLAEGIFNSGNKYDVTKSVIWTSSNNEFAVIDTLGVATGVASGSTSIRTQLADLQGMTTLKIIPPKQLVGLDITTQNASVNLNETIQLVATARYNDQTSRDVTSEAVWTSGAPEIATVDAAGKVTGVAVGQAVITANFEGQTAVIMVSASDGPTVTRLTLDPTSLNLSIGNTKQLTATAEFSDGTRANVTSMATWMSSAPNVISVSTSGMVEALAEGQARLTVGFRGQLAMIDGRASFCAYPAAASSIRANFVIPEMSWNNIHDGQGNQLNFSMRDFYCDPAYSPYTSIHFIITAGWCPYCPDYLRRVNGDAAQIQAAGGMLAYVQVETRTRTPATNVDAFTHLDSIISNGPGLRIGDGDTMPQSMMFGRAVTAFPSMFVVRRSDMLVVAADTSMSHVSVAQQIAGGGGSTTPSMPNCGASDEESYEPNDDQNSTATLMTPATFTGGICTPDNRDWYLINTVGSWTLDLAFTHATGDLDMYVWSMGNVDLMNPAGASETLDDNEQITFTGPGIVVINGYQGATAPYSIELR